ncbi:hypothetical protein H0H87_004414 [Tephrocybe sp. NHM501043]|nr:hypothetical protein H0H87_004414 [Tephrocybe sp. NHM501043]
MNPKERLQFKVRTSQEDSFPEARAFAELQQETAYKGAKLWIVDLSRFSSVTAFAEKFEKDGGRLDVLVANAASVPVLYTPTSDDWELALPCGVATRTQNSSASYFTKHSTRGWDHNRLSSSTAPTLASACLTLKWNITGIRRTFFHILESLVARSSEEGSRQIVYAAVGDEDNLDKLRGAYISSTRVCEPSDYVLEEHDVQDKLWDEVIDLLREVDPHVAEVAEKYLSATPAALI